jgi:hypothetical protein
MAGDNASHGQDNGMAATQARVREPRWLEPRASLAQTLSYAMWIAVPLLLCIWCGLIR